MTDAKRIEDLLIEEEMKTSYLNYAMSVIVSRALPDARDGLKPSQRRILVAMDDLNLSPSSNYRKCAKIAGDTSGNYHPHGEAVIYPTLVRMAQDFNMRYQLVDGQGNFGSVDGDPPAAMRYTEARMTAMSREMMEDLDKETVDFVPNYDETRKEPTVLPSKFPNLLVNGSSGIAVGMATSIPPHNLQEICAALIAILDDPSVPDSYLLGLVQGPDFPTGGIICGRGGIAQAYATGRGRITLRGRHHFEDAGRDKRAIIFTEIPFQITKSSIIEKIAEVVKEGRVEGISDVRDESDKDGMRIFVELKRGEDEEVVLNQLWKFTPLQSTFSMIMIALVNGRPQTLSLRSLMDEFLRHRVEVVQRRTRYLLRKARERLHIVDGLLAALDRIDEVITTIRQSPDGPTAKARLVAEFSFSEIQAQAILDMRLQRLTGLERDKLLEEQAGLHKDIAWYEELLADEAKVRALIADELRTLAEKYGDARRTEVSGDVEDLIIEDLITEEQMVVTISREGYAKRLPLTTYRAQGRGGKGVTGASTKEGDLIDQLFVASTHDYVLFFSDAGRCYWKKVYEIPEMSRTTKGRALVNLLDLAEDERISALLQVSEFDDRDVVFATRKGTVKKTPLSAFSRPRDKGIIAIRLDEDDRLVAVRLVAKGETLLLGTRGGYAVRFEAERVRAMGRDARGVIGVKLRGKDDRVVDLVVEREGASLLTVCEKGYGKRTAFNEYRLTNRGSMGVIDIKAGDRNGPVVACRGVSPEEDVIIITAHGMLVRTPVESISMIGRGTQGVRLIRLNEDDQVTAVAPVPEEPEDDDRPLPEAPPRRLQDLAPREADLDGDPEDLEDDFDDEDTAPRLRSRGTSRLSDDPLNELLRRAMDEEGGQTDAIDDEDEEDEEND